MDRDQAMKMIMILLDHEYDLLRKVKHHEDDWNELNKLRLYIEFIEESFESSSVDRQGRLIKELESKLAQIYCHT